MDVFLLVLFGVVCVLLSVGSYVVLRERFDTDNRMDSYCKR